MTEVFKKYCLEGPFCIIKEHKPLERTFLSRLRTLHHPTENVLQKYRYKLYKEIMHNMINLYFIKYTKQTHTYFKKEALKKLFLVQSENLMEMPSLHVISNLCYRF